MQRGNIRLKQGELDKAQEDFDVIVSSFIANFSFCSFSCLFVGHW